MPEDFLAHYGVLGMKWGVRKDRKRARERDKKVKAARKRGEQSQDYKKTHDLQKDKNIEEMSNEELQEVINRRRLEEQYKDLDDSKVLDGKRFAKRFLDSYISELPKKLGKRAAGATVDAIEGMLRTILVGDLERYKKKNPIIY